VVPAADAWLPWLRMAAVAAQVEDAVRRVPQRGLAVLL
jgi:hypothetical protein